MGKRLNLIFLGYRLVLALRQIHEKTNEVLVHIVAELLVGEYLLVHAVTRYCPIGKTVEEYRLARLARLTESVLQRIYILHLDIGFDHVAIHALPLLGKGRDRKHHA